MAMDLAHGLISIAAGVISGVLSGVLLGSTKLWSTPTIRTLATLVMSQLLMFCAVRLTFHYLPMQFDAPELVKYFPRSLWIRCFWLAACCSVQNCTQ